MAIVEVKTEGSVPMTKRESWLIQRDTPTYNGYYNGKMSYTLHGKEWEAFVAETYEDLKGQYTSENVFKTVIDMYAENLMPLPDELRGFSNSIKPLLQRGECVVVVDSAGTPHFPERFEMVSDGNYTLAAIFTRSLEKNEDHIVFIDSKGQSRLFSKPIPDDMSPADYTSGFSFVEDQVGFTLFRFSLDDKGFGASLAAHQDRVNHSIVDQTIVAEMYARPFWYLMNVQLPPKNPYLPGGSQPTEDAMEEQKRTGAAGRIFTTSSEGPFGQLEPPSISDMIGYHDSIVDKLPMTTGIPAHYFKPGSSTPPTGVALKVLSKRFSNRIARMREDIRPELEALATLLKLEKTGTTKKDGKDVPEYEFWSTDDDLLQDALDAHGLALSQMGYPLSYIAEIVTPGVNLEDYEDDTDGEAVNPAIPGQPTDMTATGQQGLTATPGQVAAYGANPGQKAKA